MENDTEANANTSLSDFPEDAPSVRNLAGQFELMKTRKLPEIEQKTSPPDFPRSDPVLQAPVVFEDSFPGGGQEAYAVPVKSEIPDSKLDFGSLRDKSVLISGSTMGIGFGIAKAFAAEGCTVWINGRNIDRINQAIDKIKLECPDAKLNGIVGDVSTEEGVANITEALPKVDILVNNTGIYGEKDFYEIQDEEWLNIFNVNVLSGVRLSRHYLKRMLDHNWGRIIFISSDSAVVIPPEMIHYGMTKIAQVGITKGLAALTQGTNVTVNSVLVGPTKTEGIINFIRGRLGKPDITEADLAGIEKRVIQGRNPTSLILRLLRVEEVANAVLYLASPKSSGTNGASLPTEGGLLRCIP